MDLSRLSSSTFQNVATIGEWLGYFGVIPSDLGSVAATAKYVGNGNLLLATGLTRLVNRGTQSAILHSVTNGGEMTPEVVDALIRAFGLRQIGDSIQYANDVLNDTQSSLLSKAIRFPTDMSRIVLPVVNGMTKLIGPAAPTR